MMEADLLSRLSQSRDPAAHPDADLRGRVVRDRYGDKIGRIADLILDRGQRVRFLLVEHGAFDGFGAGAFPVPVEVVDAVVAEIHLDRSGAEVAGAPRYDPALADPAGFYDGVYGYYGLPVPTGGVQSI
jgi:sporulation protein YlmC with PRC-barrel domain